jgi:hypothetical protein
MGAKCSCDPCEEEDWPAPILVAQKKKLMVFNGIYNDLMGLYSVNYCSSLIFNGFQWDL